MPHYFCNVQYTCLGAERDCPPGTQYMARVFECYLQHKFVWRFVVYNDLQALDKVP